MSEFKISSFGELKAILDAVDLKPTSEIEDLVYTAKEAHEKYIKTLRKVHKRILQINANQEQAEKDYLMARSIQTTVVQFDQKLDIEIDVFKIHDAGYISYLLQTYPHLYGFVEPNSGVKLDFEQVEWYSVISICDKHAVFAQHVDLLDSKYKDRLGNLDKEKVRCFVYMKNVQARKTILMNFIEKVKLLAKSKSAKSNLLQKVNDALKGAVVSGEESKETLFLIDEYESALKHL